MQWLNGYSFPKRCMMSSWFVCNRIAATTEENSTLRAATWKVACSWSDLRDNRVPCSSSTAWGIYLNLGAEWPQRSTFEGFLSRLSNVREWCLVGGFMLLTGDKPSKSIVGSQYFSLVCFPVSMRQETLRAMKCSIVIVKGEGQRFRAYYRLKPQANKP